MPWWCGAVRASHLAGRPCVVGGGELCFEEEESSASRKVYSLYAGHSTVTQVASLVQGTNTCIPAVAAKAAFVQLKTRTEPKQLGSGAPLTMLRLLRINDLPKE